jgi:hypothetical protein
VGVIPIPCPKSDERMLSDVGGAGASMLGLEEGEER